jgi:hypothetical protein
MTMIKLKPLEPPEFSITYVIFNLFIYKMMVMD